MTMCAAETNDFSLVFPVHNQSDSLCQCTPHQAVMSSDHFG